MEFKDYYQVMGLAREATAAEVKQSYRKLARKYHPDVSKLKDAEARFKELGEAYEVLKDPEKRAAYDRLGQGPQPGESFRPPPGWDSGFEFSGAGMDSGHSDFFETLFGRAGPGPARSGRRSQRTGDARGNDHHVRILLDLEAALEGGSRTISLQVPEIDAEGHVGVKARSLSVQIPKGVLAGQTIRLAGQGEPAPGSGKPGDLYVEVEFAPHPLYRVEERDLFITLPVAPWEAALGASVQTPTPGGSVELKIPAGSHAGTTLRLKGRGIPANPPGNLLVILEIALPPAGDEKVRAAYRALAAAMPFDPRAGLAARAGGDRR